MSYNPNYNIVPDQPLFRHELKFLLEPQTAAILKQRCQAVLNRDQYTLADSSSYRVTSLYYDDHQLSAYFDKLDGIEERIKYRLRAYNLDPETIHLEAKIKHDDLTRKETYPLNLAAYRALLADDPDWLTKQKPSSTTDISTNLPFNFNLARKTIGLKPRLIIDYQRTPLVENAGHVRLTFDEQLAFSHTSPDLLDDQKQIYQQLFPSGELILEVKYNQFLPQIISELLNSVPLHKIALSKYILCLQRQRQQSQLMTSD